MVKRLKNIVFTLTFWVLTAILAGALLGHYYPDQGVAMEPLGKQFINVVKLFINPIIFLTIVLGISSMGDLKQVGRVGGKAILYFEIVTTLALLIGIAVAHFVQPGAGVDTSTAAAATQIDTFQKKAANFSWLKFLKENVTIQVLLFSIVFGIWLGRYSNKQRFIDPLQKASKYVFKGLHWVMYAAPIGAFGGMAFTIGKYGINTLFPLAKLMVSVYLTMFVFIVVVLGGILSYYKISILKFLSFIREELLIVLGTSSSEAALPSLMEKLEQMGCPKPVVGLIVPAGYSFNLDGTTIYLSMAILFLAQAFRVDLSFDQMLYITGILMITSKGAAGVTGSGFVVLASTLTAVPIIPIYGLALLLGVDRFMSEARAITNFIGNGVAAIFLSNQEKVFDRDKMEKAFRSHKDHL
jgi:aerobic C4-dicarboxylate transport protein